MPNRVEVSDGFLESVGHTRESYEALSRSGQWSVRNREKHKAIRKDWEGRNPETRRASTRKSWLKRQYGITPEEYDEMLKRQEGMCAICFTSKPTGKWEVFAVDHCHVTGDVRGLLCNECNRGLGLLRDSKDILRSALDYLDGHTKKTQEEKEIAKERRKRL